MMRRYIHEIPDWPTFHWDTKGLSSTLADIHRHERCLRGRLETLAIEVSREVETDALTREALGTSAIEGEILDSDQVRSSVATRLDRDAGKLPRPTSDLEGIVEITVDATGTNAEPMTEERLFTWHSWLFPRGRSGFRRVETGAWRTRPVQVVSGPVGRERVHFDAPEAEMVPGEMKAFLDWLNTTSDTDDVLRAGIAHLWFATIHPFEDGNGRIARALTSMVLAHSQDSPVRFYSMSGWILRERADYYRALERASRGTTDITAWLSWFVGCLRRVIAKHGVPQAGQRPGPPSGRGSGTLPLTSASGEFWACSWMSPKRWSPLPGGPGSPAAVQRMPTRTSGNWLRPGSWSRLPKRDQTPDTGCPGLAEVCESLAGTSLSQVWTWPTTCARASVQSFEHGCPHQIHQVQSLLIQSRAFSVFSTRLSSKDGPSSPSSEIRSKRALSGKSSEPRQQSPHKWAVGTTFEWEFDFPITTNPAYEAKPAPKRKTRTSANPKAVSSRDRKTSKPATVQTAKPKASSKPKRVRLTPDEQRERARARAVENRRKLKELSICKDCRKPAAPGQVRC